METGSAQAGTRTADRLACLAPDTLVDHVKILLDYDDSAFRLHGVAALEGTDARLVALVKENPDPCVRCDALCKAL